MAHHKSYTPPDPNTNIIDIDFPIFSNICKYLDLDHRWRDVVCCADETQFRLSIEEVEECAQCLYYSLNASPSEKLLRKWASAGMSVKCLAIFLGRLHLERPLVFLQNAEPLVITTQPPQCLECLEGDQIQISCNATGFPYPQFAWFCEQRKVSDRQDGTLAIECVSVAEAGNYICRIHHDYHGHVSYVFTSACNVIVTPCPNRSARNTMTSTLLLGQNYGAPCGTPPSVLEHPLSQSVRLYEPMSLRCVAIGDQPLSYYWMKDGGLTSPMPQDSNLIIARMAEANVGIYQCLVKNAAGETRSNTAVISVQQAHVTVNLEEPPTILVQPAPLTIALGGKAVFHVEATHPSTQGLCYQWYHDGLPIKGATNSELHIVITGREVDGMYQVRVSTPSGATSVMSRVVRLTYDSTRNEYFASDKVALVFGISTYRSHGQPLPAVEHDLQQTLRVLEYLKFRVIALLDLTLQEMNDAVDAFCDLIAPNVYVVFYCAGHGYQDDKKRHYLIPWDAGHGLQSRESLCIDEVEAKLQTKSPALLLLFLDICRRKSSGQQAFEEPERKNSVRVPRGIFNKYFIEVIQQRLNISQIFFALLDKFKSCPYDMDKFRQNPETLINIQEYDRKMCDPIKQSKYLELCHSRKYDWDRFSALPQELSVLIHPDIGRIQLTFCRLASNVLQMVAKPDILPGLTMDIYAKIIDNPVVEPSMRATDHSSGIVTRFTFPNIQRLQANLVVCLQMVVTSASCNTVDRGILLDHTWTQMVNLGMPLIASLNLGAKDRPVLRPIVNDRRPQQPEEHSESETDLSSYASDALTIASESKH